jgi:hypothetical protein
MRRIESHFASVAADLAWVDAAVPYDTPYPIDVGIDGRGEGRYVLKDMIAYGPRSWVYLADDRRLSTPTFAARVVVKISRRTVDAKAVAALPQEAEFGRRIEHPDVPAVLDRGVSPLGHSYVVLEWVDGTSLDRVAVPWRGRDVRRAVQFIARLGRVLESAHAKNIVHCDLKPDNVRIGHEGRPLLLDFDLAVAEGHAPDGLTRGNFGFMAPEQLGGSANALSPQADVYGLGGLLIYLLMAEPVNGRDASEAQANLAARRHWQGDLGDATLTAVVRRAVSPATEHRYRSMSQFVEDLERWLAFQPIEWREPGTFERTRLWARRRPLQAAFSLTGSVLGIAAVVAGFWYQHASAAAEQERVATEARREQAALREINARAAAEIERLKAAGRTQIEQFIAPTLLRTPQRQGEQHLPILHWLAMASEHQVFAAGDAPLAIDARLSALRNMESQNAAAGQEGSIPQLLTRLAIAELLVRGDRPGEALDQVRSLRSQWQHRLLPSDPLVSIIDAIEMAAQLHLPSADRSALMRKSAEIRANLNAAHAPATYLRLLDDSLARQAMPSNATSSSMETNGSSPR